MESIQILDTSLRDGGYQTNFHFSDEELEHILLALDQSGIEFIEIGYRNGVSYNGTEKLGRAGYCDRHYLKVCKSLIKQSSIAVMALPGNIAEADLIELKDNKVDLIRLCVTRDNLMQVLPLVKLAKQIELKISLNFVNMTQYNYKELDQLIDLVNQHNPDMIYFADSNGSILPTDIKAIYQRYCSKYSLPFGFHAHDNIGLAHTNAIAAIDSGVLLIDASLAGLGKGIGNLKTEFFIAYLHAIENKKYNLAAVLKGANYVRQTLQGNNTFLDLNEFIKGITDNAQHSTYYDFKEEGS